ncbi:hypothetical protein O0L34_g18874 [Tuta absoluta]|nr:hypothetical protein O0L34_g18874 [Tuta absoluta]
MDNDSLKYQPAFEKLEGVSNFNTWKFQMTMTLKLEDLWSCIDVAEGVVVDVKKDTKALARISLAIKTTCIQYVRSAKTAKDAWNALCAVFEDKGFYRRVMLLRQLHRASYNSFNSMEGYIEFIMNLVHQLADIGRTIDDQEVAELLLSGLSQEFDIVVSSLESANVTGKLTSEQVRTRLLQEEHRKKNNDNNNNNDAVAFVTKKKPIVCHFCHRPGHVKAKCYRFKKSKKQENADAQAFVATHRCLSTAESSEWLLDSGATAHMSNDLKWFSSIKKCKQMVSVANGATLMCYGRGEVRIPMKSKVQTVTDTMFVSDLSANLISIGKLSEKAFDINLKRNSNKCYILDRKSQVVASATKREGVYVLDDVHVHAGVFSVVQEQTGTDSSIPQSPHDVDAASLSSELWHRRLGHLSHRGVSTLSNIASGIKLQPSQHGAAVKECVSCVEGKQAVQSFPRGVAKRATQLLELVHSDVCGPMPVCNIGGSTYLLTFTDDFSRKIYGYLLKQKSEVLSKFKVFKATVEKQTGCLIKRLRSDRGGEYCSAEFSRFLESEGIVHETTAPYSPAQNGVSERLNRTLMEKVRCMLQEAGFG